MENIRNDSYVIPLDLRGKQYTSEEFSNTIKDEDVKTAFKLYIENNEDAVDSEKDYNDIKFGCEQKVDAFALSFVRTADDVLEVRMVHVLIFLVVDDSKIVVFGFSIGTGMATYVASQREVNGLILLAPYDNALNLYNDNVNIFYGPIEKIRKYRFESDKNIFLDIL